VKDQVKRSSGQEPRLPAGQRQIQRGDSPLLELQRTAGNAAVAHLVEQGAPTVQREGIGQTVTEFVKDTYHLVKGEKDEEKEKDPDLITDTLEKAIKRIGQVQKGLTAGKAIAPNKELAEHLGEASEAMEKYGGYVEKGLTGYKVYKLVRAAKALDKVDLLQDPDGGAEAFDEFFSTLGEAGEDICDMIGPEGKVVKPYFTFLKGFKHFFSDWARFIKAYTKRIDDAAQGNVTPLPAPEEAPRKKEPIAEKPVKFDQIGGDLQEKEAKYDADQPEKAAREILRDAIAQFMVNYSALLDLWRQRKDVGFLGIEITSGQRERAQALLSQMGPLHDQAATDIQWVGRAIPVEADKAALDRYWRTRG
jgi:hypothetical protein